MKIKAKTTVVSAALVLFTVIAVLGIVLYSKAALEKGIGAEIDHLARGEAEKVAKDANGRAFIKSIISKALSLQDNNGADVIPVAFEEYSWKNAGDTEARMKTSAIAEYRQC